MFWYFFRSPHSPQVVRVAKGRYKEALVVRKRVMIYGVCAPRLRSACDPSLLHVRVAGRAGCADLRGAPKPSTLYPKP